MMRQIPLALLAVLLVVLGACASDDAEQLAALTQPCSLSSDCSNGLACVFGRCHTPCRSSVDCTPAATDAKVARCLRADPNVCVLDSETTCVVDGDCAPGTVCGVDRQCRSGCGNDGDCLAGQQCSYRTCADESELGADGELVVLDETGLIGTACTRNSECTPRLRCIGGLCDRECRTNVDCAAGLSCSPTGLCVTGTEPPPNGCLRLTCESAGANCGQLLDGCGGVLQCDGTGLGDRGCPKNEFCGSDGRPNVCGPHPCQPADVCAGRQCGQLSDGCATVESCGTCRATETCDDTQHCVCTPNPNVCDSNACGPKDDGCGTTVDCGGCEGPDTCGGAGVLGTCGCLPKTCATAIEGQPACGTLLDGCGGVLDCTQPEYACPGSAPNCGGGGTPNRCGSGSCGGGDDSDFCMNRGWSCGTYSNGCDKVVACGACTSPESCGGGNVPYQCGCTPTITEEDKVAKCAELGKDCGAVSNGCGGTVDCGTCSIGTCGSGGVPNVCSCKPKTCGEQGLVCGVASDGCGGRIVCGGQCAAGTYCGAVEPNKCAPTPAPGTSCPNGVAGCEVASLPAGNFDRVPSWYNSVCRGNQEPILSAPAHVSAFRLDVKPVTAARYREYLGSGYFQGNPPPLFAGRHRNIAATLVETGWQPSLNAYLPASRADFDASNPDFATLLDEQPVALEWARAFAFCIWDGGRLPTENEYLYAAYGGEGVARDFPWREVVPSTPGMCPSNVTPAVNDDFGLEELGLRGEWAYDVVAVGATSTTFDPAACATLDCVAFGSSPERRIYGSANSNTPFTNPTFAERRSAGATPEAGAAPTRSAFRCAREVP